MRTKLLNSAMMPQPGLYESKAITHKQFCELIWNADQAGKLDHYIGYQQNCDLLQKWLDLPFLPNRGSTTLEDGDQMVIMRLKYRPNPEDKGKEVKESDFEFFHILYRSQ